MTDASPLIERVAHADGEVQASERACRRVCVLLSGGVDSSACVAYYVSRGYDVKALFIDYGQPNVEQEIRAASKIAAYYRIELHQVHIEGQRIPLGYVPARNAVLLSLALMSVDMDSGLIAMGIHAGTPYVDCSPLFVQTMQRVVDLYTDGCLRIDAPFINWTKGEIWEYIQQQDVPVHLTFSSNPAELPSEFDLQRLKV